MTRQPPHIVVAGGGVAAVEAVAALRALTGPLFRITVLAPEAELSRRQASVATPFGFGLPPALSFDAISRHARFDLVHGKLARVEAGAHVVVDESGETLHYDKLLVAVGARPLPAVEGAITFTGPDAAAAVARALDETTSLAFVLPDASTWSLPVYELALMAATELRSRGLEPQITVVTPESSPLWVFGAEAGAAVAEMLAVRGIALRIGHAVAARDGKLELEGAAPVKAERVIALPRLIGPAIAGLPHVGNGFIPADRHGRVPGVEDVFAAGDATTFPLKQGGLAAQQADAAAEKIAAELGAAVTPAPFRPVMRGLLLTGGAPLYLRASLSAAGEPETTSVRRTARRQASAVSGRALWWPPSKVAGRYLAGLMATARPPVLAAAELQDFATGPPIDDREDALELALMLAEEDAAMGDYGQALRALDAASALSGGVLPAAWEERRAAWQRA